MADKTKPMTPEEANQTVDEFLAKKLAEPVETKPAEVAVAVITKAEAVPVPKEIELTAEQPQEMEACQRSLIDWCKNKMLSVAADCAELQEAYEHVLKNRWKSSTLKRHVEKAKHTLNYYTKMCGALEAGYVLVPNMPGALFAVRTDKVCPSKTWHYSYYEAETAKSVTALEIGEGEYVAARNDVEEYKHTHEGKVSFTRYKATDFGELEFPFSLSKPRIMEATSRAMALRLFDEFMILPADAAPTGGPTKTVTREDPIVLGIVAMRRGGVYTEKKVSFMVAWHINTRDL